MGKGGLIIDVLAGPPKSDESADDADVFDDEDATSPKADPESLISGIESQLAQLRAWARER